MFVAGNRIGPANTIEADDNTLPQMMASASTGQVLLIVFYMSSCPACKHALPQLESLASRNPQKVKLIKCDMHNCRNLVQQFGVQVAPTIFAYTNGRYLDRIDGVPESAELERRVVGYTQ